MSVAISSYRLGALRDVERRAVWHALWRWAWRLLRREWRQQLLILALVTLAVGATVVGSTIATNMAAPATAGFGAAQDKAVFSGSDPRLASEIRVLRHRFGPVEVIENQSLSVPGSVQRFELRSQDPTGPFGRPMLRLVNGTLPGAPDQVAITPTVASAFGVEIGGLWHDEGRARRVIGIVEDPQNLRDEFALVVPGQVRHPTEVTVLFDGHGVAPSAIGANVRSAATAGGPSNTLNPSTISLGLAALGMLLVALVAVGGFTVLSQRRQRALGMLASLGASERNVATVVVANGALVGALGSVIGLGAGLVVWLAARPAIESSAGHLIDPASLPWAVIAIAVALAVLATSFAAWRPARACAKASVVASLAGRPAPPAPVHRSGGGGLVLLAVGCGLGALAGVSRGGPVFLVPALVSLVGAMVLLSPLALAQLGRSGAHASVAVRIALRDLARYRARSASALAAVSLGALIAVVISVAAAAAYSNPVNYLGPNLAPNQLVAYTPAGNGGQTVSNPVTASAMASAARSIARALGAPRPIELQSAGATLDASVGGQHFTGPLYVATPQLFHAFGIAPSTLDPQADVLTVRPGLAGLRGVKLVWGRFLDENASGCPRSGCRQGPVIQHVAGLPSGTSAPNTVLTEQAVKTLGLRTTVDGWLVNAPRDLTADEVDTSRQIAVAANLTIETKSSAPGSAEIATWATVAGIAIALAVLAMAVGLLRAETAKDLRVLAATGATSRTRRTITAATASSLALLGAVLGTVGGYVGVLGYVVGSASGLASLAHAPLDDLGLVLVVMPLVAAAAGYLLGGREPPSIVRRPLE